MRALRAHCGNEVAASYSRSECFIDNFALLCYTNSTKGGETMIYAKKLILPSEREEIKVIELEQRTCFHTFYLRFPVSFRVIFDYNNIKNLLYYLRYTTAIV